MLCRDTGHSEPARSMFNANYPGKMFPDTCVDFRVTLSYNPHNPSAGEFVEMFKYRSSGVFKEMSYRMMVIMTWQDQVHCYINISCHSPSVLCHKAAGSSQATLWRIGELFLWEAEDSKSSEWDQLLLKMRRKKLLNSGADKRDNSQRKWVFICRGELVTCCVEISGQWRLYLRSSHKNSFLKQSPVFSLRVSGNNI